MSKTSNEQHLVRSYLFLRKGIGSIGLALPIVLVLGRITFESPGILDSISGYYYSVMRNILVGSLWAIAIFLICYRYERLDDIASTVAGVSAIGVAIFPAAPDLGATPQQMSIGWVHFSCAVCFFLILAFFALVVFQRTDPEKTDQNGKPTHKKQQRNIVYRVCGIAIIACLVFIFLIQIVPGHLQLQPLHPVFWLESLAIFAFGIAWFVKGETILKDE